MSKAILKNVLITAPAGEAVLDTLENEALIYSDCEIRGVTVLVRGESNPFSRCLFRDCDIRTEGEPAHGLRGQNIALDCTINGEETADFRTY